MAESIKQRVEVDAGAATAQVKGFAEANTQAAAATAEAGKQAQGAAKGMDAAAASATAQANTTKQAAAAAAQLKGELSLLQLEELAHNQAKARGGELDQASTNQANERKARIQQLNSALGNQTAAQKLATEATKEQGQALDKAGENTQGMVSKIGGAIAGWGTVTAALGVVLALVRDIGNAAVKSYADIAQLGGGVRALATNIGGKRADQLVGEANKIARDEFLSTDERNNLLKYAGSYSDVYTNATNPEMVKSMELAAKFQRATGTGGAQAFQVIDSLKKRLGIGEKEAFEMATTLQTSGFEADTINQITQKTGGRGGADFLAMLLGAKGEGLDPETVKKSIPGLLDALTRSDNGRLPKAMSKAGVTDEMDPMQRLQQILQARSTGQISEKTLEEAVGGSAMANVVVGPIRKAIQSGMVAAAQKALANPNAMDDAIAAQDASVNVRALLIRNQNQVRQTIASEANKNSAYAIAKETVDTQLIEQGGGSWWTGLIGLASGKPTQPPAPKTLAPPPPAPSPEQPTPAQAPAPAPASNQVSYNYHTTTIVNPTYTGVRPDMADSGRREEGRWS